MKPFDLDQETWDDWLLIRKDKHAPRITATALKRIDREAAKIGWTLAQAIEYAAEMEWRGFKSAWVKNQQEPVGFMEKHTDRSWASDLTKLN